MPSLRDYRDRIASVKSTRKITSAMKMVAASKLRRAQEQAEEAQPYANAMAAMMARVASNVVITEASSPLLAGTGSAQRHLLIVMTSDRGLCGGFNGNLIKRARTKAYELMGEGKDVHIVCVGRKCADTFKREMGTHMWKSFTGLVGKKRVEFAEVSKVTDYVLERFDAGDFDVCTLIYNEFKSVLSQVPIVQQLIPFNVDAVQDNEEEQQEEEGVNSPYDFEPTEEEILDELLPRNIGVQIFRAMLDSAAGEQAARMTAMDNATRNAGDMINDLTLAYNRARQASITKELIEIISGAEAV